MGEKDGLGLDLSLSLEFKEQQNQASFKLNLMPFPSLFTHNNHHTISCNDILPSSSDRNSDARLSRRGIDVNRLPLVANRDDETGISSPISTISSLSGKRSDKEQIGGEETEEAEKASFSLCGSDDEDGGDASRKKLRLSKEQSLLLEETFKEHNTLNPKQKLALAKQLNLTPRQVEVWFQNRRARTKLKQTEVDCEHLKKCCENLTQENRRLQKEVQELRALKLSPQLYMHMNPPTTLTMCPSCERVAVSSSSVAAAGKTGRSCHPANSQLQRPAAMKPWAGLPIQHRPSDMPASKS